MADVKWSELPQGNETDPINIVGLQNGKNIQYPVGGGVGKRSERAGIPIRITGNYTVPIVGEYTEYNSDVTIDAFPDDGGSDIVVTLPDPATITTGSFAVNVSNQSATDYDVEVRNHLGALLVSIPPVNGFKAFFDSIQTPEVAPWELMHVQGAPIPALDVAKYGDFNSINYDSLKVKEFSISGLGSQFLNSPFTLLPTSFYTFECTLVNTGAAFIQTIVFTTDSDFSNPDLARHSTRAAVNFASAAAVGWRTVALDTDAVKSYFSTSSVSSFTIGTDAANPSFLGPISVVKANGIELFDGPTGAVRNISGKTIEFASGTINFNPNKTGGGSTILHLISERSTNGTTWMPNLQSLRVIRVVNDGESFQTKLSFITDWLNNEILRFRIYAVSGGAVTVESPTDTIAGNAYTGPSLAWELSEK